MTAPQLPHNPEAEKATLGALIESAEARTTILTQLTPTDFYHPAHQTIYQAISDLYATGQGVDAVLVAEQLKKQGDLERIGGQPYLFDIMTSTHVAANATQYATIITETATLRRLIQAGAHITQLGYQPHDTTSISHLIDQAQQTLDGIQQNNTTQDYVTLTDALDGALNELADIAEHGGLAQGVPTGFTDLDNLTNGLHGGQMIIVAARPGAGKSTVALDFMRSCSITHNKTSAIFSLEMSRNEIIMRLLSAEASIKLSDMRAGKMNQQQWTKLATHVDQINKAPLIIDDSANITMTEIIAKSRKIKQEHGLDLIVVDYLQLLSSGKKVESRQQEVSEFSRALKLLAKDLNVPVIAISQLNRGPEQRPDKRPQIADLRESGSLEQDADMVMLLYRPDSHDKDSERAGEADIILAKHRGGPIDTIAVAHQLHYSRFVNLARGM